jgi:hypothetical protein
MYAIFVLTVSGYEVDKLELIMIDYYHDKDVYPMVFDLKKHKLNFNDIPVDNLIFFLERNYPNIWGLNFVQGASKESFDLRITKKIIDKFFTFNETVNSVYNEMKTRKNLQPNDYIYVWARRSDKIYETKVPSADRYIEEINKINVDNKKIVVQTDERAMLDDFLQIDKNIIYFEDMPFATMINGDVSFHQRISQKDDTGFLEEFKVTKDEYFVKMCSVVLLSINSYKSVVYPGNATTIIPVYRNTFDNCILFKNEEEII